MCTHLLLQTLEACIIFAITIAYTSFRHVRCHRSCNALKASTCLARTPCRRCLPLLQPLQPLQLSTPVSAATGPATPLKRAPAWLKRPAGAAFGFGNRLVSFKNVGRQGHAGEHIDTGVVTVSHVSEPCNAMQCRHSCNISTPCNTATVIQSTFSAKATILPQPHNLALKQTMLTPA